MMLSAILPHQTSLSCSSFHYQSNCGNLLFNPSKPQNSCILCRATESNSSSLRSLSSNNPSTTSSSATLLRPVSSSSSHGSNDSSSKINRESDRGGEDMVPSASAVAAVIRKVSTSPVEFVQRIEKAGGKNRGSGDGGGGLVLPSADFQRLCLEQLDLFRRIVHPDALLSIYVRPAGSYVMDQLELRRITYYPNVDVADIVILVGNFSIQAGLRAAEAALSNRVAEHFPEFGALVFPMVKHPFVVGFLVAEVPQMVLGEDSWSSLEQSFFLPRSTEPELVELRKTKAISTESIFTTEQRSNATNISRSLAMAYVMDQKAMLLQQSSWQNNVRMSSLVEQIRGSLSSIQTLSKMLSVQLRRSEISYDIAQDIMVQGDHMRDTLQQLQDAVYLTKANIIRSNGGELRKINEPTHAHPDSFRNQISSDFSAETSLSPIQEPYRELSLTSTFRDSEVPMPPFALAPQRQEGIRPCNVSELLTDLVGAVEPLAQKQQRSVRLCELSRPLQVAIEEPALRQALSNLIEGALLRAQIGGKVEILSTGAPAGGALVIIDDDGPDMHYMTQMHTLTPFGMDLFAEDKMEDNMTWNFVAGLTVAREILESYGCVIRVISPRKSNLAIGHGGTRIELWLPFSGSVNTDKFIQMV